MASRVDLCSDVDLIIERLSGPLSKRDRKAGWSEKNRAGLLRFFHGLRERLEDPTPLHDDEKTIFIAREMDFMGIEDDEMQEHAARISNELRRTI